MLSSSYSTRQFNAKSRNEPDKDQDQQTQPVITIAQYLLNSQKHQSLIKGQIKFSEQNCWATQ